MMPKPIVAYRCYESRYPATYTGLRFNRCYHCHTTTHIKSGGCWTAKRCERREWWIL